MANEQNLLRGNPETQFNSRTAVEAQKKSAEARKRNTAERKLIKERILERMKESDWEEMIDGVIERAKFTDKAFEVFRDTIGEKPKEDISINGNINNPFAGMSTDELRGLINND